MKNGLKLLITIAMIVLLVFVVIVLHHIIKNFATLTTRFGVIDLNGNTVIPFKYSIISKPNNGVYRTEGYLAYEINSMNKIVDTYYIDSNGNRCTSLDGLSNMHNLPCDNRIRIKDSKTGKYGFFDFQGNSVNSFTYDDAQDFSYGYAPVANKKGKYGVIGPNEVLYIPYKYDSISPISNSFFIVEEDGEFKIIDYAEMEVGTYDDDLLYLTLSDYGSLPEGEKIYDDDIYFGDKVIIIEKDNTVFIYDNFGQLLEEYDNNSFDDNPIIGDNYCVLKGSDGKESVIDLLTFQTFYTSLDKKIVYVAYNCVVLQDKKTQKYGMVDYSNSEVLPFEYDSISASTSDLHHISVVKGSKKGLLDVTGKEIIELSSNYYYPPQGDGNTYVVCKWIPKLVIVYTLIVLIGLAYIIFVIVRLIKLVKGFKKN